MMTEKDKNNLKAKISILEFCLETERKLTEERVAKTRVNWFLIGFAFCAFIQMVEKVVRIVF